MVPLTFTLLLILPHTRLTSHILPRSQYIEGRFQSKALRTFCVCTTFLVSFLYLGLCAYTPSLALQTITGLPAWVSIIIMGLISTFYSAWVSYRDECLCLRERD